ncbi:MAG: amidohydrolase family protein [Gemmatimonadales bacterium]|jgi:imidazolonepropionase-like amidohydrolase
MLGAGTRSAVALAVLGVSVLLPRAVRAQFDEAPPPAVYALSGVTVVQADGSRQENVTIIVRRGFIEAMGPDVEIPAGAEVLEGDSLMVYPGLIDGHGGAEIEIPEPEVNRQELEAWDPPRDVQGFTPHRRAVDFLTATGPDLRSERAQGVVAGAVFPSGPVMPGRGAFAVYRTDAETPRELVTDADVGLVFTLRGARGAYPGTLFGVKAFHRQALENARHQGTVAAAHQRDPRDVAAPRYDPDYDVLRLALGGTAPVYYMADHSEDVRTALELAEQYDLRLILVGGQHAWRVAEQLRERRVPVLVSLDFPDPERWEPEDEAAEAEEVAEPAEAEEAAVPEAAQEPEPLDAAAEREKRELETMYRNAGRLAQAGVRIALTSGGGETDLLEGTRTAVECGLDPAQALQALTTTPAALFGVQYLTRIERGMPATFIVTDGPLFDEETRIVHLFVEGGYEEGRAGRAAGGEAPAVDMTGEWDVSINAEGQDMGGTMTLTQEGAEFSGTMTMELGTVRIRSGIVSGNDITFTLVVSMGGETLEFDVEGTVQGDEAEGSGSGAMGSFTWSATRTTTPGTEVR